MNQLAIMSDRLGIDSEELNNVIVKSVMPKQNVTPEQFTTFMAIANEYQLNPLAKEIFAFPAQGGGIQPIVSIDGWLKMINEHPQFNGMQIEFSDRLVEHHGKQVPEACTVRMWRKDRDKPVTITEYLEECARNTDPWKQKPRRMLQHKAVIQAARYSFSFSGIMDQDEAENMRDMGKAQVVDDRLSALEAATAPIEVPPMDNKAIYKMFWEAAECCDDLADIVTLIEDVKLPDSPYQQLDTNEKQKLSRFLKARRKDLEALENEN